MMMKFLKSLFAPAFVALVVASAANGSVWQWSKTAATNASVDASINWAEGMSPSSVNDSARAMMARIADWRDDFSGVLTTAGTSTAYTITTNQGMGTPTTGQLLSFTPHLTNGATPALTADGGFSYNIQTAPGVAVASGVLIAGTPYSVKFSGSAWILHNYFGSPSSVPIGAVLDYTGSTTPNSSFVFATGQCVNRTTYAEYFALVGTTFSTCDGVTTFGIPDLRGRVVAGLDFGIGRISVAGGNFNPTLGAAGGSQNQTLTLAQLPNAAPAPGSIAYTPSGTVTKFGGGNYTPTGSLTGSISDTRTWATAANALVSSGTAAAAGGAGATGSAGAIAVTSTGGSLTNGTLAFSGDTVAFQFNGTGVNLTLPVLGSGNFHPTLPPTMVLNKIVRIF